MTTGGTCSPRGRHLPLRASPSLAVSAIATAVLVIIGIVTVLAPRWGADRSRPGTWARRSSVYGLPQEGADAVVARAATTTTAAVILGILFVAGASALLVLRAMRPLGEVAQTAARVSALPLAEGSRICVSGFRIPSRARRRRSAWSPGRST